MRSVHVSASTPARLGLGRPAVLISLGLHVVFFVVTLGVPRLLASSSKSTPVYVVDLVSLGSGGPSGSPPPPPAAASKAPAAAPEPPKPKPAPTPPKPKKSPEKAIVIPDRNVKKTPTKEIKKPPVKPEPKAEPAAAEEDGDEPQTAETPAQDASQKPAAATSAPAAAGGAPGGAPGGVPGSPGSGAGQGEGVGSDPYNFYIALLNQRIKGAWKRPLYGGKEVLTATVSLEVSRSGRVLKLDLVSPSGMDALDKSVMRAVRDAEPFPPLPTNLALDTLPVKIAFDLKPDALGSAPGE